MSVTVKVPVRVPVVVGLNVTLIEQDALAARLDPQELVWEKSPLVVMLVMARVAPPVFVRAMV